MGYNNDIPSAEITKKHADALLKIIRKRDSYILAIREGERTNGFTINKTIILINELYKGNSKYSWKVEI